MKTKNIVLIGIILLTWYYPVIMIFSTLYTGISGLLSSEGVDMMRLIPFVLIIIIFFCTYVIGILVIDLGLRRLFESKNS